MRPTKRLFSRSYGNFVTIVEVGPRDGLQNEPTVVPTPTKINFIDKLSKTGLKTIEATSFVSPKWVPQMADSAEVFKKIRKHPGTSYPVLVPNLKGLESALDVGVEEIAIFGSASEAFSRKNINCSIAESLRRFAPVAEEARKRSIRMRGYVSCIVGCPYEGPIEPFAVREVAAALLEMGCYEVSLGDTIGVGTPRTIGRVLEELKQLGPGDFEKFALHCHDTYGQALANIYASLELGVRCFDSSVAGLGGCPYAAGASGNVATEDLVYLLQGQGLECGVDLDAIVEVGEFISKELGRENRSKVGLAVLSKKRRER